MPTAMPPGRKPTEDLAAPPVHWLSRMLNWTALFVGLGLCFWALNYGVISTQEPNSPSRSGTYTLPE